MVFLWPSLMVIFIIIIKYLLHILNTTPNSLSIGHKKFHKSIISHFISLVFSPLFNIIIFILFVFFVKCFFNQRSTLSFRIQIFHIRKAHLSCLNFFNWMLCISTLSKFAHSSHHKFIHLIGINIVSASLFGIELSNRRLIVIVSTTSINILKWIMRRRLNCL